MHKNLQLFKRYQNEIFPNTPTATVQLFIIIRESNQEKSIIKPICEFKLQTMAKDIENGFNSIPWRVFTLGQGQKQYSLQITLTSLFH